MTPERRAELKRLCEALPHDRWCHSDAALWAMVTAKPHGHGEIVAEIASGYTREQTLAMAAFIAAAREAVPELLAEAEALHEERVEIRAALISGTETADDWARGAEVAMVQGLRLAVETLRSERDALKAEVERLKGMKPELPPRPPDGSGLPRYGLRWNGALPLPVPMPDGFWTPWHLALARVAELEGDIKTLFRLGQVKYVRDHACGQCLPEGGDLVREGFVCAYHQCAALVGKEAKP